jgi:DNA-binding sugar fermentation-stimulating protein
MKLKHREIAEYRAQFLEQQQGRCALCNEPIEDDAVLDHCHKTGKLRRVLHRGCNSMLGKIENNMPRSQMTSDRLREFAKRLVLYIDSEWDDLIHPTHKTAEERKECIRRKRRKSQATVKRKNTNG